MSNINKINATIRYYLYKKNNLPNSILYLKKILKDIKLPISKLTDDGRTNSFIDEKNCLLILKKKLEKRIQIPKKRHWFDFTIYDFQYGYLSINFKSTTCKTSDNTGNLSILVQSLSNKELDFKKKYNSGKIYKYFLKLLKNPKDNMNTKLKKDYYFLVINKETNEIIVNSIKGLTNITGNSNNLPFQIKWNDNKKFVYTPILTVIENIKNVMQKPILPWKVNFLLELNKI